MTPVSASHDQPNERARQLVELVTGRWTPAVLAERACGGRRYQDLRDALDGIGHNVLTDGRSVTG